MVNKMFEPKIMVFVCNWCSTVALEAAVPKAAGPTASVRMIRVLCSGMVDPNYVIKALASGADGVLIVGCHRGNCHYISGNIKALRRSLLLAKLLSALGVRSDRFRIEWIGHSEPVRLTAVINEMCAVIQRLGPFRRLGKAG